jgi:hypothetical protein
MSSIFGGSKPAIVATPELDEKESKLERQEIDEKRKIASKSKARRTAGSNMLMAQRVDGSARGNPTLGNIQNTLGVSRNTRNS